MRILLPLIFFCVFLYDIRNRDGENKKVYTAISAISLALCIAASVFGAEDHMGASLSGMISIFMR